MNWKWNPSSNSSLSHWGSVRSDSIPIRSIHKLRLENAYSYWMVVERVGVDKTLLFSVVLYFITKAMLARKLGWGPFFVSAPNDNDREPILFRFEWSHRRY